MSDEQLQSKEFEAEVSRLLEMMIHSVYSESEVFLRELIANSSDACDRLRYMQQTDEELQKLGQNFQVDITLDKDAGTITINDNGIGMSEADMVAHLGTIARSGTRAFAAMLEEKGQAEAAGIGQFGVGFYSAFIVAHEVEVLSKAAGSSEVTRWVSDGTSGYRVGPAEASQFLATHGTRITLHIRESQQEYLDASRLKEVVKKYAEHIAIPVRIIEVKDGAAEVPEEVNAKGALWTRNKNEILDKEYAEFYRGLTHHFDEPAHTIHYRAEGRMEYSVLLFIPQEAPFDLYNGEREAQVKLHVKKMFITDKAEILPGYLRFVKGLVDCADLPLNISREMLQNSPQVVALRKAVTNRVLTEMNKIADRTPEQFEQMFEKFGPVLKEGLYEDHERKDDLLELIRFRTTTHDGWRSLKQVKEDMKEGQQKIYYITGRSREEIDASPHLEGFKSRDIEVLILSDPIDDFWVNMVHEFDGTAMASVTRAGEELKEVAKKDQEDQKDDTKAADGGAMVPEAKKATLVAAIRQALKDDVADVKLSERLTDSPVCLVADHGGIDLNLEKILAAQGQSIQAKRILEINPDHPYILGLARRSEEKGFADEVREPARLLHDLARVMDGEAPSKPKEFVKAVTSLLQK